MYQHRLTVEGVAGDNPQFVPYSLDRTESRPFKRCADLYDPVAAHIEPVAGDRVAQLVKSASIGIFPELCGDDRDYLCFFEWG